MELKAFHQQELALNVHTMLVCELGECHCECCQCVWYVCVCERE